MPPPTRETAHPDRSRVGGSEQWESMRWVVVQDELLGTSCVHCRNEGRYPSADDALQRLGCCCEAISSHRAALSRGDDGAALQLSAAAWLLHSTVVQAGAELDVSKSSLVSCVQMLRRRECSPAASLSISAPSHSASVPSSQCTVERLLQATFDVFFSLLSATDGTSSNSNMGKEGTATPMLVGCVSVLSALLLTAPVDRRATKVFGKKVLPLILPSLLEGAVRSLHSLAASSSEAANICGSPADTDVLLALLALKDLFESPATAALLWSLAPTLHQYLDKVLSAWSRVVRDRDPVSASGLLRNGCRTFLFVPLFALLLDTQLQVPLSSEHGNSQHAGLLSLAQSVRTESTVALTLTTCKLLASQVDVVPSLQQPYLTLYASAVELLALLGANENSAAARLPSCGRAVHAAAASPSSSPTLNNFIANAVDVLSCNSASKFVHPTILCGIAAASPAMRMAIVCARGSDLCGNSESLSALPSGLTSNPCGDTRFPLPVSLAQSLLSTECDDQSTLYTALLLYMCSVTQGDESWRRLKEGVNTQDVALNVCASMGRERSTIPFIAATCVANLIHALLSPPLASGSPPCCAHSAIRTLVAICGSTSNNSSNASKSFHDLSTQTTSVSVPALPTAACSIPDAQPQDAGEEEEATPTQSRWAAQGCDLTQASPILFDCGRGSTALCDPTRPQVATPKKQLDQEVECPSATVDTVPLVQYERHVHKLEEELRVRDEQLEGTYLKLVLLAKAHRHISELHAEKLRLVESQAGELEGAKAHIQRQSVAQRRMEEAARQWQEDNSRLQKERKAVEERLAAAEQQTRVIENQLTVATATTAKYASQLAELQSKLRQVASLGGALRALSDTETL